MRKNWLARAEANAAANGARRAAAALGRRFRAKPVAPESAFQDTDEPYPGHWRRFPDPWPPQGPGRGASARIALGELPETWRRVLVAHDVAGHDDEQVAVELGLSVEQVRDIVTLARAAVRDWLDGDTRTAGEEP